MKGVLLVNLGSPESPTAKDVKPYLDEFLMDKYVIDVPFLLRALLVRGIILQTRPKKSAAAYARIWWEEGSPLVVISKRMHKKVQEKSSIPVALAMRYGTMTIEKGLQELREKGVTEVLLLALYPQYAMASTTTIWELADELVCTKFPEMKAHEFCYRHQCYETTKQVVKLLGIPEGKYSQTFQSRLAGDKWLTPYTDVEINKMPEKGIKKLAVVTPAFVSDCLETLEEIAMEANEQFLHHGGEEFLAIPCMNDDDEWCGVVANWIKEWSN